MKKIIALIVCTAATNHTIGMDMEIWNRTPEDVSELILLERLSNTHTYIRQDKSDENEDRKTAYTRARQYIISISYVNRACYKQANDRIIIRTIIGNIANHCKQ